VDMPCFGFCDLVLRDFGTGDLGRGCGGLI
jgi:hypothetical protein